MLSGITRETRVLCSKYSLTGGIMKTCSAQLKRCNQYLSDNRETNDKQNPLYTNAVNFKWRPYF